MSPDMQYRDLGRTGEKVSVIGLGGYHLGRQADPEESVRLVRTAIDRGIAFTAVKTFQPMTQQQIASLLDRTRDAVADGRYELFKTTAHFDGTAANPKWLG
jgi:predicted aldo/keto reductase-like oxidoreductase